MRAHIGPYGPVWARPGPARALEEREKFRKNVFLEIFGSIWLIRVHIGPYGPLWARMGPARALEEREKFKKTHLFAVSYTHLTLPTKA